MEHYYSMIIGVVVAALANWLFGMIWYNSRVFGTRWMKLIKNKPNPEDMKIAIIGGPLLCLVAASGLMYLMLHLGITDVMGGIMLGIIAWFGLVFPVTAQSIVYEKYSKELYLIGAGYNLLAFGIMGATLSFFV
jgi:hypothetical protein